MAKFNFETYEQTHQSKQGSSNSGDFKVKFFKLANGETQILRFPYHAVADFDTVDVHTVKEDSKFRKISCLRTAYEPLEKCPLCASGDPVKSRFLAKVLYYEADPTTGSMIPKAGVWDSPLSVARQLKDFINEYGDISGMIFKVTRTGEKLETKYSIIPANSAIYKDEIYPVNYSDFDGLNLENRFYFVKNIDEINTYLSTGSFPQVNKSGPSQNMNPVQNQIFTPQSASSNYINEAVDAGQQVYFQNVTPVPVQQPSYVQQQAQANVVETTITQTPQTGRRYSY